MSGKRLPLVALVAAAIFVIVFIFLLFQMDFSENSKRFHDFERRGLGRVDAGVIFPDDSGFVCVFGNNDGVDIYEKNGIYLNWIDYFIIKVISVANTSSSGTVLVTDKNKNVNNYFATERLWPGAYRGCHNINSVIIYSNGNVINIINKEGA